MHWQNVHIKAIVRPLRGRFYYLAVKPQVSCATLSSPAVTDIRRLRRRLLEINSILKMRKFTYRNEIILKIY